MNSSVWLLKCTWEVIISNLKNVQTEYLHPPFGQMVFSVPLSILPLIAWIYGFFLCCYDAEVPVPTNPKDKEKKFHPCIDHIENI